MVNNEKAFLFLVPNTNDCVSIFCLILNVFACPCSNAEVKCKMKVITREKKVVPLNLSLQTNLISFSRRQTIIKNKLRELTRRKIEKPTTAGARLRSKKQKKPSISP